MLLGLDLLATLALGAAGAPPPPAPVQVVLRPVRLTRHDTAPVTVSCRRARRSCRGVVVLGARCDSENQPVALTACQEVVGTRRFAIGPRRRAVVHVRRTGGGGIETAAADRVTVNATAYEGRPRAYLLSRYSRALTLGARPGRPGPARPGRVVRAYRSGDQVVVDANVPIATTAAGVAIGGRRSEPLHRRTFSAFLALPGSFTPSAARFHGAVDVPSGESRAGDQVAYRLTACAHDACAETTGTVEIGPDPRLYPGPICMLPVGPAPTRPAPPPA